MKLKALHKLTVGSLLILCLGVMTGCGGSSWLGFSSLDSAATPEVVLVPEQTGISLAGVVASLTPGDPASVDNPDQFIGDTEIQAAFGFWIKGEEVAGAGQTISDIDMRQLIQSWIGGERIDDGPAASPLPPSPSPGPNDKELQQTIQRLIPSLREFQLVSLNSKDISEAVAKGRPVQLPFIPAIASEESILLEVSLEPANLLDRGAVGQMIRGEGEKASSQKVNLTAQEFAGKIANTRNGIAGFSLNSGQLTGAMWIPEGKTTGWSFLEPLGSLLRENGASESDVKRLTETYNHIAYNANGVNIQLKLDEDEPAGKPSTEPDPDGEMDLLANNHEGHDDVAPEWVFQVNETLNIYLFSDVQFYNSNPSTVWSRQRTSTLWVSILYGLLEPGSVGNGEFDLPLNIVGQATWISGGPSSTDSATLLGQSYNQFPWNGFGINRNNLALTHFFTGKNIDGTTIGRAWKIGGVDDTCGASYSTSGPCQHSLSQPEFSSTNFYLKIILLAHELGHVMGGLHGSFNPNYVAGSQVGPTIMRSGVTGSQVPYFSATNADTIGTAVYLECVAPILGADIC